MLFVAVFILLYVCSSSTHILPSDPCLSNCWVLIINLSLVNLNLVVVSLQDMWDIDGSSPCYHITPTQAVKLSSLRTKL
jgi:hypothetical protein